jgi:protein-S-isoprenylcysteine O-methyltransferase Ste14
VNPGDPKQSSCSARPDRDALKNSFARVSYMIAHAREGNDFAGRETFDRLRQRLGAVAFTEVLVALGLGRMEPCMRMTLRLAFITAVSLAAYLGLAIAGAGGFGRFFSHPPLTALVVVTIAAGVAALFTEGDLRPGVREDRSNRWVLLAFMPLGLLLAWLPAYADRRDLLTFGGEGVRWLGVAHYAVGGVLRLAPVFVLGRRFSGLVAIQPDHRLVTGGIYGIVRHPSYLGLVVNALGWSLAFRSGIGVFLVVLILLVLIGRMNAEERLLGETFGAEYEAYRARTWRLVPYVY